MKFRKKPVVIEALQFTDEMAGRSILAWIKAHGHDAFAVTTNAPFLQINTMEGQMTASLGDWIIQGVKGEFYPCKPEIFAATYEPAE